MLIINRSLCRDRTELMALNHQIQTLNQQRSAGAKALDEYLANTINYQGVNQNGQIIVANSGVTPADAYRDFDRISKEIMNPSGEFTTFDKIQQFSRSVNIGKEIYTYRKVSADNEGGMISRTGQTGVTANHTSATYDSSLILTIDKGYGRGWKELESMRADGYDALLDDDREATLTIKRLANDMLWEGSDVVIQNQFGNVQWQGLRNSQNVERVVTTLDLIDPATTADEVYNFFRTQRDTLRINNNVAATIDIMVSRELMSKMETPFAVYDKGFGNILQMVKSLQGIGDVVEDPKLSGSQVLLAHFGFQGLSCLTSMALATVAIPRTLYNSDYSFIKAMGQGFVAKVDAAGHKSVLYAAPTP